MPSVANGMTQACGLRDYRIPALSCYMFDHLPPNATVYQIKYFDQCYVGIKCNYAYDRKAIHGPADYLYPGYSCRSIKHREQCDCNGTRENYLSKSFKSVQECQSECISTKEQGCKSE